MAVLGAGYAAVYDGTTWSQPTRLSSAAGQPDSVSCPTVSFCMAVDADDSSSFVFNGSTWSAPVNADPNGLTMGEGGISWPVVSCPASNFCAAVDGAGGNVVTFDGSSWTAPVTIDSKAANSVSGPVLMFLMSVSCLSASFCVTGDSIGDAFVRS